MNLIINAGSATYKYTLFDGEKKILHALYQKKGERSFELQMRVGEKVKHSKIKKSQYENSLKDLLDNHFKLIEVNKLGFRVVHGGRYFKKTTKLNTGVLKKLKKLDDLAPLHNPFARKLIEQSEKLLPKVKKYLIFDTAFHASIPEINSRYAIPGKISKRVGIKRYGFHGIVCSSIVNQLKQKRRLPKKLIVCHLGGGCSVTAIRGGKSVDTSMGFTPLEGLVMATRAGDIDPGLILHLQKKLKLSPDKLLKILNEDSGLKALAGSRDMREILKKAKRNNTEASLAIEIFCSKVAKYVAVYIVSLQGVDRIVFSGGIGSNSPSIRHIICTYLKPFGIRIDAEKNKRVGAGKNIQKLLSTCKISWMEADEASEINSQL